MLFKPPIVQYFVMVAIEHSEWHNLTYLIFFIFVYPFPIVAYICPHWAALYGEEHSFNGKLGICLEPRNKKTLFFW